MKKFTIVLIMILSGITLFAQKGLRNPAAAYCEFLGYSYSVQLDAKGNEYGICILPDGKSVNAWDFYKGKVGQEYSYGAIKGYKTDTEIIKENGYTIERAVYIRSINNIEERLTLEELLEVYGDYIEFYDKSVPPDIYEEAPVDPNFTYVKSIPDSFDWRSYNGHSYIGGVKNQGSCGSCYAFGATACAEGTYNFATGNYDNNCADFSEAYIAWCLSTIYPYSSHFNGCYGADYDYYEIQALVDIGTIDESYFPYYATNASCPPSTDDAPKIKFEAWYRVPCADYDAIKTAIMTYGVVDAAVYATSAFQDYSGGVFSDSYTSCNTNPCYYATSNHAIALVGWGTDPTEGDYWILRNSWGSYWGEGGYMRLSMSSAHVDCSVCYMVYEEDGSTAPVLTTNDVTNIEDYSAESGGNITSDGGRPILESGLVYSKNSNPTTDNGTKVETSPMVSSGSYNLTMSGLLSGTTYYVRAYATNSKGTSYGEEKTFTTTGIPVPEYCTSASANASREWIARVSIGDFTNTSGSAEYTDFTDLSMNLTAGETYDITLEPDFSRYSRRQYWKIWIDLNYDGDFDDSGENVFDLNGTSRTTVNGTITIPPGTDPVTTRMRITMKYRREPTPCEYTFRYGEVEDYTVVIGESSTNIEPIAEANGPYEADLGDPISFSSTNSNDPDGTIASYHWDFGNDDESIEANPSYTYNEAGNYTATLTVTDDEGATNSDEASVSIIGPIAPTAEANGPYEANLGDAITFSSAGSNDPDGTIESYHWDFGNGAESTLANPSYTYAEVGNYTVTLTVTDNDGLTDTDQATVSITENIEPTAEANGPYEASTGNAITFSSNGSNDSDGSITNYHWNFGNGDESTQANPSYAYPLVGDYTATLTVTDNGGLTDSDEAEVSITESSGGNIDELGYTDFESGWDIWSDGGSDCRLYRGSMYAYEGRRAADIQDNSGTSSSFYLTNGIDVDTPGYTKIDVEFYFIANSMDNSDEDFWVQYYDGSTWHTVATFAQGIDFENRTFYSAKVSILEADYTFPSDMQIRFMCDASDNRDDIYIDNIKISASNNRFIYSSPIQITKLATLAPELSQELSVFPNPADDSEITISSLIMISKITVYDISGRVLKEISVNNKDKYIMDISDLKPGIYIIKAVGEDEIQTVKLIKE